LPEIAGIIFSISADLSLPEVLPRARPLEQVAIVEMPEAAINENGSPVLGEDQIRFPWQRFVVEPVSVSEAMKPFANP
jgi:hypothetical protein